MFSVRAPGPLLIAAAVAWTVAATVMTPAIAATLASTPPKDGNVTAILSGEIAEGDADALEALMKSTNDDGRLISGFRLDSPGGSLAEAVRLANIVQRAKIATIVAAGSRCASACFVIFAAGNEKFAAYAASVGVHGASNKFGQETDQSAAATISMARIVKDLGVPTGIIGKMVVTPADQIVWLSPDELRQMGTVMIGPRPGAHDGGGSQSQASVAPPADVTGDVPTKAARTELYDRAFAAAEHGNFQTAVRIWLLLAEQGDAISQYDLGQMYYAGQGVAQNFVEAAKWFRLAAEQGLPHAQLNLGTAYALGRGVPQDFREAYKWLNLATATYTTETERTQAAKARDLIAGRMTPGQIAEAQQLARDWVQERQAR